MGLIADIHKDLEKGALQLMVEYRERLNHEAIKLCGDQAKAEDLVLRTIERVLAKADTYKDDINLYAWMVTIMENIHKNDMKRPVVRGTTAVETDKLEEYAGADWSTDEEILKNSDSEALRKALSGLDPKYHQALLLRYYQGFSVKQIAAILQLPLGTVCRRLQIAHGILAGKLKSEFGRAKKPLAILGVLLLGAATLFGAWQGGLLGNVDEQKSEASASPSDSVPAQNEEVLSNDKNTTQQANATQTQEKWTMKLTQAFAAAALATGVSLGAPAMDAGTLSVSVAVEDYDTCVPVVTATFPTTATSATIEWSGSESGPYATLVEVPDLAVGSFAFTNEHALVADRRYYRVVATDGNGAAQSSVVGFTRYHRLDRMPGRASFYTGAVTWNNLYKAFDGNLTTYDNASTYDRVGISYDRPVHVAGVRFYTTSRGASFYNNKKISGTSAATGEDLTLNTVTGVENPAAWYAFDSTIPETPLSSMCVYALYGNIAELQVFGWDASEAVMPQNGHINFDFDDYVNCAPVIEGRFQWGADKVVVEIGRKETGPFSTLAAFDRPAGSSVLCTNESAKVGVKRFYRVGSVFGAETNYSAAVAFTRFRQIERDPTNQKGLRSGYSALGGQNAAFDGNTGTSAHGGSISKIGVDFNEQVYIAARRVFPFGNNWANLCCTCCYGSKTLADYSAGTATRIAGITMVKSAEWSFAWGSDAENSYQCCYVNPAMGDVAEFQIFGWTLADIEAGGDPFFPTGLTADNAENAGDVALAWTGGKNVETYDVQYRVSGSAEWTTAESGLDGKTESCMVGGLVVGERYEFRVVGYAQGESGATPVAQLLVYRLVPGDGTGLTTLYMGPVKDYDLAHHCCYEKRTNETVNIDQASGSLFEHADVESAVVMYRGKLIVPIDGDYTLSLTTSGSDGFSLWLDGASQINTFSSASYKSVTVTLAAGEHDLAIDYRSVGTAKKLLFQWALDGVWSECPVPQSQLIPASDAEALVPSADGTYDGWDFSWTKEDAYTVPRLFWTGAECFKLSAPSTTGYLWARNTVLTRPVKGAFSVTIDLDKTEVFGSIGLFVSSSPSTFLYNSVSMYFNASGQVGFKGGSQSQAQDWISAVSVAAKVRLRIRRLTDGSVEFATLDLTKEASDWVVRTTVASGSSDAPYLSSRVLYVGVCGFGDSKISTIRNLKFMRYGGMSIIVR